MNKPAGNGILPAVRIETTTISYGALDHSDALKALPAPEKKAILDLYYQLPEEPEKVVATASEYIAKYPNIPILYNYAYSALRHLSRNREAIDLLKKSLKLFPDYLFGRTEYAHYLLRRGEPEKAHAVFENAHTLSQLYPDRKVFHVTEWIVFFYVMGLIFVQKDDLKQAKVYLVILNKIASKCAQAEFLEKNIRSRCFINHCKTIDQ
jgi:tetratricopeptide (TPR) repeat protein